MRECKKAGAKMDKIITVEEVFSVGKRGVIVMPLIPIAFFDSRKIPKQVEIRLVNGKRFLKKAEFSIPRQSPPPKEYSFGCFIANIEKVELPVGAEIWADLGELE